MASKNLRTINNNDAYAVVNAAYKQATGASAVDTEDLSDFCDSGVAYDSLTIGRDKFYAALLDQVVNFYNDSSYDSEYIDPFFVESRRFASILAMIDVIPNAVEENAEWDNFRPNTGTNPPTYATVGTYTIKPSEVQVKYATKNVSWQLPVWINEAQERDAFKNEAELRGFIDYIYLTAANKLQEHRMNLSQANVASLIGHKILADKNGTPGIHKVNLLAAYNADRGKSISTVAAFMADADALRYAGAQIMLYSKYMRAQTTLFNNYGLVKFCPADRLVLEVNSAFESAINEVSLSTTWHDEYVELPGSKISVPAWQGFGVTDLVASTQAAAFDQVTKIDVTIDKSETGQSTDATITQSGVVAILADQFAAINTIRSERVGIQRFDIENLVYLAYQHRDQYVNNLAQNAIVFTVEAPETPGPASNLGLNPDSRSVKKK